MSSRAKTPRARDDRGPLSAVVRVSHASRAAPGPQAVSAAGPGISATARSGVYGSTSMYVSASTPNNLV